MGRPKVPFSPKIKNCRWKFNEYWLQNAVERISIKCGYDVTPDVDGFCLEENKQCDKFITEEQDFFSNKFNDGYFGTNWSDLILWANPPYQQKIITKTINFMQKRRMQALLCIPSSGPIWENCEGLAKARRDFKVSKTYPKSIGNLFFPSTTGYKSSVGPPKFDVTVFLLDYRC